MSDTPSGWTYTVIGEIADIASGIGFPKEYQGQADGEIPFCKVSDISNAVVNNGGNLTSAAHYVSRDVATKLKGSLIPVGSTIFAKIGEAIKLNRRALVRTPCLIDNNVMAVIPKVPGIELYLFYYLKSIGFGDQSRATTVPSLRKDDIASVEIPLPPLNEQRRIADKLELLLERVNSCRERLVRLPELCNSLRQSVLSYAMTGKLTGDDAAQWTELNLQDLCAGEKPICYGVILLGDEVAAGTPCLRTSNVKWLRINTDVVKNIAPTIADSYPRTRLKGGEVLVNVRGTLGGVAVVPPDMDGWNVSREIAVVTPDQSKINPNFLAYSIGSHASQQWLTSMLRGVAYTGINIEHLKKLPIRFPNLERQDAIVRHIKHLFDLADEFEMKCENGARYVNELPSAMLAKAFRGELVPQDLNDEPAETLLAGIAESALERKTHQQNRNPKVKQQKQGKTSSETRKSISEVLKKGDYNGMEPQQLLYAAGYTLDEIEQFYVTLAIEVKAGKVREIRHDDGKVLLTVPRHADR